MEQKQQFMNANGLEPKVLLLVIMWATTLA